MQNAHFGFCYFLFLVSLSKKISCSISRHCLEQMHFYHCNVLRASMRHLSYFSFRLAKKNGIFCKKKKKNRNTAFPFVLCFLHLVVWWIFCVHMRKKSMRCFFFIPFVMWVRFEMQSILHQFVHFNHSLTECHSSYLLVLLL